MSTDGGHPIYPHRDHAEPELDRVVTRATPPVPHPVGTAATMHTATAYAVMPWQPKRRFRRRRPVELRLPREALGPPTMQFVYVEGMPLLRGGHDAWVTGWLMAGAEVHVRLGLR